MSESSVNVQKKSAERKRVCTKEARWEEQKSGRRQCMRFSSRWKCSLAVALSNCITWIYLQNYIYRSA